MAYTSRRGYKRPPAKTSSKVGRRSKRTRRRAGAFGLYRGTSAMTTGRTAARAYGSLRSLNPFPNTKLVRHKYVDSITIPAGGGASLPSVFQFLCNGMYDPDVTGVGHQPLFRDEMVAQYSYYTVLKSSIKIEIAGTNAQEINYLLWVDDDTTVPATATAAMEQHWSKIDRMDRRNSPLVLRASFNAAKWNKTTQAAYLADEQHKTTATGDPTSLAKKYYTLYLSPVSGLVTLAAIPAKVTMYFYTLWREPVDHIGS